MAGDREFLGVWIPKEIWLNNELSIIEKALLVEIQSLDNEQHCWASNGYFAKFFNCSVPTITRAISHLTTLGLIKSSFNGRSRVLEVCEPSSKRLDSLIKKIRQPNQNDEADSSKRLTNNIKNNTSNNTSNKSMSLPTIDEIKEYCNERGNGIEAEQFYDYYESVGWKVGSKPMKNWKACVRTWERKNDNNIRETGKGTKLSTDEEKLIARLKRQQGIE